jgi:hypothetical protein
LGVRHVIDGIAGSLVRMVKRVRSGGANRADEDIREEATGKSRRTRQEADSNYADSDTVLQTIVHTGLLYSRRLPMKSSLHFRLASVCYVGKEKRFPLFGELHFRVPHRSDRLVGGEQRHRQEKCDSDS